MIKCRNRRERVLHELPQNYRSIALLRLRLGRQVLIHRRRCRGILEELFKVAPNSLQSTAFLVDLGLGAETQVTENGDRRAPSLDRVLQEKAEDENCHVPEEPAEEKACECDDWGVDFNRAFDVPFAVQLAQAFADGALVVLEELESLKHLLAVLAVDLVARVLLHARSTVGHDGR